MSADNPEDVVRLATAATPFQAHILQQALEDEGIRCRTVGDYLDAGIGDIPGARAEIWVHRQDLARAEAVLREKQGPPEDEEADELDETV